MGSAFRSGVAQRRVAQGLILLALAVASPRTGGAAAPAGPQPGPLSFERWVLSNGLEVIVHEDHTVPVVAIDVWYHVGSKDEERGRTGFAHLFEHLMFQGSAHVGDDQHFRHVSEAGGWCNGTTNKDRTNYFEVLPSNFLERGLWLESDRMGFLLEAVTQDKLDKQRDVVRNERRQNYENRPYGMVPKAIAAAIYPPDHPYHWLTIGEHADLEAATLDEVRGFFRRHYGPANATLAIAGDVSTAEVRRQVERYFGRLPGGIGPGRPAPRPVRLEAEQRLELSDRVALERIYLVWPAPAIYQPGDGELDLAAAVLGGKSGRLYQRLVYQERLAQSVEVGQSSGLLASTFQIAVTAKPGHSAAELLPLVDEELTRLRKEGPTPGELEKAQNGMEASLLFALMPVGGFGGRADRLARYSYYARDPGYFERDLERYRGITAAQLRQVFDHTTREKRLVLTVKPISGGSPAADSGGSPAARSGGNPKPRSGERPKPRSGERPKPRSTGGGQ